ncbi:MAG TPA: hypothetical protein VGZ90_04565 [Puia sp.]|jgi:hypothetical protein|nr:hypothetical protein [Puia sp.]
MQNGSPGKADFQIIYLFLASSFLFFLLKFLLPGTIVNYNVLLYGNLLLFVVSWISARMSTRAVVHKNVQVFLRLVYGSFLMKFFVLAIAAFVYISIFKKEVNKPALFGCFGLYIIYTFIEVRSVLKQSKKPNA